MVMDMANDDLDLLPALFADALNRLLPFCVSSAEQAAHGTVQADRF
jgi:hypothetical protein